MFTIIDKNKPEQTIVDNETRMLVIASFSKRDHFYYHTNKREYQDFIDGMAWVGFCCGAAYKAGDLIVAKMCEEYLKNILKVGPDARNYCPIKLNDKYVASTTMPGYFYRTGQSYAGPAGLGFAIKNGADLSSPYKKNEDSSKFKVNTGFFFGILAWIVPVFRQHINSYFLAHIALDKKPSFTMKWMAKFNPLYSYAFGKIVKSEYPVEKMQGKSVKRKKIVEFNLRKPSSWVFRSSPYKEYVRNDQPVNKIYTPIARLTAEYLQHTLKG